MGSKGGAKRRVIDYHIDMHWGICWGPVDSIDEIRFKGEDVAWSGTLDSNGELSIDLPELFGGNDAEGGVIGKVHVLLGGAAQVLTDKLAGYLGLTSATAPGYRGIASLWFHDGPNGRGFMVAQNNPFISPLDVKVTRISKHANLNDAHASMDGGSNAVHMVFEVYTNSDWGLGWPVAAFNLASWLAAAETIYNEGIGLSMMWTRPGEIEAFVAEILDHIQAAVYTDPTTGLIEIKLFRDDYDLTSAKTFDPDNCTLEDMQRRALEDTINEIVITYTNPENEEEATVTLQDLANISAQSGQIKSDSRNYYGVRKADHAWTLGERDIREASYPLFSCKIITDRSQGPVVPGEVVELVWPEEGIASMAVRVLDIDKGKKGSGKMILSVTEDIWSLDKGEFETPPTTSWTVPVSAPEPFDQQSAITVPYPFLSAFGATTTYSDARVVLLGQNDDSATESFTLTTERVNTAGDTVTESYAGMLETPFGALSADLVAEAESTIADADMFSMVGAMPDLASGQLFYLGDSTDDSVNEIIMLKSYGAGAWTVKRGIYDTVPRDWSTGTELWYLRPSSTASTDPNLRAAGADVSYWLRPKTISGVLDVVDATELVYSVSERPHLPFRPANVKVEADGGWGTFDLTGFTEFTVTWANRNRTLEDTVALYWDEATVTPEDGQTTTIRFVDLDGNLIVEYTGLTGTSYDVPMSGPTTDGDGEVKIQVLAERDGLESLQYYERQLTLVDGGYGVGYGESYGTGA
jgi:hypothetical protein